MGFSDKAEQAHNCHVRQKGEGKRKKKSENEFSVIPYERGRERAKMLRCWEPDPSEAFEETSAR